MAVPHVRRTMCRRAKWYGLIMLREGDLAPDFDVPAHDGSRVHLADLAGKYVLLWFYPAADTPG
jgi:peroxiredoxin